MKCKLVDVFSDKVLNGNGLTIFSDYGELTDKQMLSLTQEMRQFESIFVENKENSNQFKAKIFTMEEELDFAGHPLLGLGAHLHQEFGTEDLHKWQIELNSKSVSISSERCKNSFNVTMEQGKPEFLGELDYSQQQEILDCLNLDAYNLAAFPIEVISTGLPYLIVPVKSGLSKSKIQVDNFESILEKHQAKFVYVLDIKKIEGRTWDNDGAVEDIATGSAAGPVGAYLFKHGLANPDAIITLQQGRFIGRPSKILIELKITKNVIDNMFISGSVCKVADINFAFDLNKI